MARPLTVDLFAEDRAHEEFLRPLIERIARELRREVTVRPRPCRGGYRVFGELEVYQRDVGRGLGGGLPDALVAGIDGNCRGYQKTRERLLGHLAHPLVDVCIPACPDPHVERWYLADPAAFGQVVGVMPSVPSGKCVRDFYKRLLSQAVLNAGHPPMLGGVEFAREIVEAMSLSRAGKAEPSLGHLLRDLRAALRRQ